MLPSVTGRIVIATHNKGKLFEFKSLLSHYGNEIVSAGELGLSAPEETGATFHENAILKAKAAALATANIALADDSGLCVAALGGGPGLYSARWADEQGGFAAAMQRINKEMGSSLDRSAYFICVLALYWPDGHYDTVEGRIDGTIAPAPRGEKGHGYDPIFIPKGSDVTFAEMGENAKNRISHRSQATKALTEKFFTK